MGKATVQQTGHNVHRKYQNKYILKCTFHRNSSTKIDSKGTVELHWSDTRQRFCSFSTRLKMWPSPVAARLMTNHLEKVDNTFLPVFFPPVFVEIRGIVIAVE